MSPPRSPGGSPAAGPGETRPPRPPWSEFRAALDRAGFRPSRRLGQNFLLDDNLARAIAHDAAFAPGERVFEVGAGCGFLSVHLAHLGARLLAVEIDPRLLAVAARFLAPYPEVELLGGDVLAGKHALAPAVEERLPLEGPWHLCANLPYSIGAPVLALLAGRDHPPDSMTVLVQREVAQRLEAQPGTREWGPLTVAIASAYEVRTLRRLGPQLFWPRPRVESSVARLERRADLAPAADRARLSRWAALLMQRRRQGLARVVRDLTGDRGARERLRELGLDPSRRAETLALPELWRLVQTLPEPPSRAGAPGS